MIAPLPPFRIFAVSDLHVGAPYSAWARDMAMVEAGLRTCDAAVLCGDMFEGTAMQLPLAKRISMSKQVMKRISDANPSARIHLVFGNHEAPIIEGGTPERAPYLVLGQEMRAYAATLPNVVFHEKGWVQLGDAVFTHGHKEMGFTEKVPSAVRQVLHLIPNVALPGKASGAYVFPTHAVTNRIFESFAKEIFAQPVNHVVFGHTHAPMQAYRIAGKKLGGSSEDVQFHNLGAAIVSRSGLFQPLMFEQDALGVTQSVRRFGRQAEAARPR